MTTRGERNSAGQMAYRGPLKLVLGALCVAAWMGIGLLGRETADELFTEDSTLWQGTIAIATFIGFLSMFPFYLGLVDVFDLYKYECRRCGMGRDDSGLYCSRCGEGR